MGFDKRERRVNKVFDVFVNAGFLIGSRAYGGWVNGSDYDVVINENTYQKIKTACRRNKISLKIESVWGFSEKMDKHNMFNTLNDYIFFPNGKKLNILAYAEDDMPLIKEVHKAMKAIADTPIGKRMAEDKQVRINVFQCLKDEAFKERHKKEIRAKVTGAVKGAASYPEFNPDDDIPF